MKTRWSQWSWTANQQHSEGGKIPSKKFLVCFMNTLWKNTFQEVSRMLYEVIAVLQPTHWVLQALLSEHGSQHELICYFFSILIPSNAYGILTDRWRRMSTLLFWTLCLTHKVLLLPKITLINPIQHFPTIQHLML